jgi:hypothetical protein
MSDYPRLTCEVHLGLGSHSKLEATQLNNFFLNKLISFGRYHMLCIGHIKHYPWIFLLPANMPDAGVYRHAESLYSGGEV